MTQKSEPNSQVKVESQADPSNADPTYVNLVIKQQVSAKYHSADALISLQNGSTMNFRINKTTPLKKVSSLN